MGITRREFLAAGAAAATAPWLNGCQNLGESEYYQAGLAWGRSHRTMIWSFLARMVPQLLGYVKAAEEAGATSGAETEVARLKEAARYYGFDQDIPNMKSNVDWGLVGTFLETILGGAAVETTLKEQSPGNYHKLLGIADGSLGWLSRFLFFILQCGEITGTIIEWGGACSALMLRAEATTLGEPLVAKNFDLNKIIRYANTMRRDAPAGRYPVLAMTLNLLPGAVSATNGRVALTENWLTGLKVANRYLPASCVIQDAAESCGTTQEVVDFLDGVEPGGYFLVPVIDTAGDMALIQNTPAGKVTLRPEDPFFVVTNHHLGVLPDFMQNLMNMLLPESTYIRHQRITALVQAKLDGGGKMSLDDVFATLADHAPVPGDNSVCRHADKTVTVGSIVMLPASGRAFMAFGSPCEVPFEEIPVIPA